MNYEVICKVVLGVFAVLGIVALLKGRADWLLWQALFAMTMGAFNWYAGTLILPIKITLACTILYLLFRFDQWQEMMRSTRNSAAWLCLGGIGLSIAMAFIAPAPEGILQSSGLQRREFRPLVQFYAYVSAFSLFPLSLMVLTSKEKVTRFCKWYVGLALVSVAVAAIQFAMTAMGREFMPILRWNAEQHSDMAAFAVGGVLVKRVYGFAGEPKHLALFLMPALFVVLMGMVARSLAGSEDKPWWTRWWVLLAIGFTFLLTFSSAGLIALVVGLLLVAVVLGMRGAGAVATLLVTLVALFLIAQAIANYTQSSHGTPGLKRVLEERTFGRFQAVDEERYEMAALKYMWEKKGFPVLFGFGPGMYVYHMQRIWDTGTGIDPLDSGWVALLMDAGLLGVGLCVAWVIGIVRRNMSSLAQPIPADPEGFMLQIVCLSGLVAAASLNLGIPALPSICLFAGALEAARRAKSTPVQAAGRSRVNKRRRRSGHWGQTLAPAGGADEGSESGTNVVSC